MAKTSERRAYMHATLFAAGVLAVQFVSGPVAKASGLPLRAPCLVIDPAMAGLSEGLYFKLQRLKGNPQAQNTTWQATVEDALLIAQRLGFPADGPVTAQRINNTYVILLQGEGHITGADPDQVLGRMLYTLAHPGRTRNAADITAAALSIVDQPLSVTVAALASNTP